MTHDRIALPPPDFRALFESVPGLYLVLLPDAPQFTIVAVSDAYLRATMTERTAILGRGLFEVFPDNPDDPDATGVSNLRASLNHVLEHHAAHTMAIQKYDIRRPDSEGGGFEERFWSPVNSPVLNSAGEVVYLLHRVEDVTEFIRLERQRQEERRLAQERYTQAEQRAEEHLLRAEGLHETNSQLRKIVSERQRAEEALRLAYEFQDKVLESAVLGVGVVDTEGRITLANSALAAMLGCSAQELKGKTFVDFLFPEDLPVITEQFHQAVQQGVIIRETEARLVRQDGFAITVSFGWSPLTAEDKIIGLVGTFQDMTEKKRMENQLLQAQKLESVGRLAGGVAHDFNNLLTAILGYTELMSEECDLDATAQEYLEIVQQAAEKASGLTRQLLAFARRQLIEPRSIILNDVILNMDKMLRRLIGEHIELIMLLEEGLYSVRVDPGQFEQILVNLVVNARDAMPDGGKITIETHNTTLDEDYARMHDEVIPGEYVALVVSDTGTGMEEGIRLHIFEPFYTTKEKGRGTGLGLATVYGIVRQAGGHIWLYSEVGVGTTFRIYLPRTTATPEALAPQAQPQQLDGSETILLVEDEPAVRMLAVQALRARGYTVLEAMNGEEALRLIKGREREIALLITDVIMPQMNGKELAARLQKSHPDLKVLFASGYTEDTIVHHGVLEAGIDFLPKPFTPTALARRVREVLDRKQNVRTPPLEL